MNEAWKKFNVVNPTAPVEHERENGQSVDFANIDILYGKSNLRILIGIIHIFKQKKCQYYKEYW